MMRFFSPFLATACLLLGVALNASARADVVNDITFTGYAACLDSACSSYGSGSLTGTYSLDVTTQTIGAWSFTSPFGTLQSTDAGASATAGPINTPTPSYHLDFAVIHPGYRAFIDLYFPASNPLGIGDLATYYDSVACMPYSSSGCQTDYLVTGKAALTPVVVPPTPTPEPSSLVMLGSGLLAAIGAAARKYKIRS